MIRTQNMNIRAAQEADQTEVISIMNYAIAERRNAYTSEMDSGEGELWFRRLKEEAVVFLVCELEGVCAGWGVLSHYRQGRGALEKAKEISFYVHPNFRTRGVGKSMLLELEAHAIRLEFRNLIAILLDSNAASKSLLMSAGYRIWGHHANLVQWPDGQMAGHLYMSKSLFD